MPIESVFDLIVHFPIPNFPVIDPDIVLVAAIKRIPVGPLLNPLLNLVGNLVGHAGLLGLGGIGMYFIANLYSHPSRETVLSGKIRDGVGLKVAARILDSIMKDTAAIPMSGPVEEASITTAKPVNVSAFAPPVVSLGDDFYIQIILHSPEQISDAKSLAENLDKDSHLYKSMPLFLPLREGDQVRITVEGRGAEIQEPDQTFVWRGYLAQVAFGARLPTKFGERRYRPLVRVFVNGAPSGIMVLELEATLDEHENPSPVAQKVLRFNKVFMSYASADRAKVLDMAKMLRAQKIDFFQDILSLEPGERWEKQLYKEIAQCDAFYLFWSSHAKVSKWVIKEAMLALQHQKDSIDEIPYFSPIIIEGPPIPEPPPELSEVHFNDPLQHMVFAEEAIRRNSDENAAQQARSADCP
jgi:TIR domain